MAKATKADLQQWQAWEDEIVKLRAQAGSLAERQAELVKTKLLPHVQAKGGKAKCCAIGDWRLSLSSVRANVSWKPEFLKVFARLAEHLGLKQSPQEEAAKIVSAQPTKEELSIEKVP